MYFLRAAVCAALAWASLSSAAPAEPRVSYDGTKVFRIPTGDQATTDKITSMINDLDIPTWTGTPTANSLVDVQVSKDLLDTFHKYVNTISPDLNSKIVTVHEDLGASIAEESEGMATAPYSDARVGLANDAWFNNYHTYAEHTTWLSDLVATFPSNSRIVTAGNSYAGRAISGVNIYGSGGPGARPAVVFHGTVHAREWIATMVTEQIAYSLLSNYTTSSTVKGYIDNYDIYIFPIVNPDGFVYTQTNDRLWRKNRQPPPSGSSCYGRDINRNWNWQWGTGGSSSDPCSETYRGISAGDSPEFQAISSFLTARKNSAAGAKLYMDWHAYGLYFLSPYGYSCSAVPADRSEHTRTQQGFAAAFRSPYGTSLTYGPICNTLYQASGSSVDWAYANGYRYSFTPELRGTSFVLPAAQIRPSGIEAYEGVKYLLANMI